MDESSKLESSDESDGKKYYAGDRILCVSSFPWVAHEHENPIGGRYKESAKINWDLFMRFI